MGTGSGKPTERFGAFEVFEKLGYGGMAVVHRARRTGIEGFTREVALKRLLPHLAADERFVAAFVREAKLAVRLRHPNIAQIYELGRVGGIYYIAMEYVQGHDLRAVMRALRRSQAAMPLDVVVAILLGLCEGLEYAHTRTDDVSGEPLGIVHRDLSLSNLIIARGHVKVIDFGVAKAAARELATQGGRRRGTQGYMAPEVLRGFAADARSDLFSVGVVAHELVTGRRLFDNKHSFEGLRRMHEVDVSPPSAANPSLPPMVDDLVMRALARDPEDRTPSADAMWRELHSCVRGLGLDATPDRTAAYLAELMPSSESEAAEPMFHISDSWLPTTELDSHPPV